MTSLGSIALKVLDAPLSSGAPVLAKRKSVVAKVDDAKREEKEAAELARARRRLADAGFRLSRCLSPADLSFDDLAAYEP